MAHLKKVMGVILALAMVFSIATVNASALFCPKPTKAIANFVDLIHLVTDAKVTDGPVVCPLLPCVIKGIGDLDKCQLPNIGNIKVPADVNCQLIGMIKKVVDSLGDKELILGKDYGISITPVLEKGRIGYKVEIKCISNDVTCENYLICDFENKTFGWEKAWDYSLLFGAIKGDGHVEVTITCPLNKDNEKTTAPEKTTEPIVTKPATDTTTEEPVEITEETPLADITVIPDNTPLGDSNVIANTGDMTAPALIGAVSILAAAAFVTAKKIG